ncbi:hypothetical protein N7493_011390 [Penicillium malachiteum]|uniref:C2H2-type domain-containing protein n=1 Tax=Penicillium malachiteum TaxID=1324776 RepID=A0AAD6HC36_9EURO|nr:hypothetical protein N7493_011390 [Penicillium malachiteum]
MHVYADLQSYICTHAECKDVYRTFRTRRQWSDHEFDANQTRSQWCCSKCSTIESTQDLFKIHLEMSHGIRLRGHLLEAAISQAEETALSLDFKGRKCDVCAQNKWTTRKAYITHMGQHLEEISLACLPRDVEDSSDDGMDIDSCNSMMNSNEAGIEESHRLNNTYSLPEEQPEQHTEPSPGLTIPIHATRDSEVDASSQDSQKQPHAFPARIDDPNTTIKLSEQQEKEEGNCAPGQLLTQRASSSSGRTNSMSYPDNKELSSSYTDHHVRLINMIESVIPDVNRLLEASESTHSHEPGRKEFAIPHDIENALLHKDFYIEALQFQMRKVATE